MNKRGPSIDPWETPDLLTLGAEIVPLSETHWCGYYDMT